MVLVGGGRGSRRGGGTSGELDERDFSQVYRRRWPDLPYEYYGEDL